MVTTSKDNDVLLRVKDLKKHFPVTKGILSRTVGHVKAVDGLSFDIKQGETLGLVGESGCGKTTTSKLLLGLESPTEGTLYLDNKNIHNLRGKELQDYRTKVQPVFQDPWSSLNPRMRVKEIVAEPLIANHNVTNEERDRKVAEAMELVGLSQDQANNYPHEFSGGQRQRIGIARALADSPSFIVCDEPVSALDVSIQAQVINLLEDLQQQFDLTYLFIAHDLSVVKHISNRIAVMYLGHIVEIAERNELYENPLHPYTQALLSAIPIPDPVVEASRDRIILEGDVPSPSSPPSGCVFHTRCPIMEEDCKAAVPELREVKPNHWVSCIKV